MLNVLFISPQRVIFEGRAKSVVVPGELGVCTILPYHRNFLSRLLSGWVVIDKKEYPLKRGIVKVDRNEVVIIGETP
ncbi:MAG: hypothetical protein DRP80_04950 [Candidatus Omnitrophota bacterium]|nr:MAG: hypothetical protein DRP69_03520 [Candidatus Omnitrophota bacterium]RKY43553.1 MAG: hypothetical protein DRP80_04950 [Candidatus Omnitrophota bacterium]